VTPSFSAASEKLRRSTTSQNAASWRVSISVEGIMYLANPCQDP
jgi:hypothetical protein